MCNESLLLKIVKKRKAREAGFIDKSDDEAILSDFFFLFFILNSSLLRKYISTVLQSNECYWSTLYQG